MLSKERRRPDSVFGAVALLIGTAIGAGLFALPYVISKTGVIIGIGYLISLGVICWLVNLAYGEVVLSTTGTHQFPAYVEKYLGKKWKLVAVISLFIGLYGALTAYLLEVGKLIATLSQPWWQMDARWFSTAYLLAAAVALWLGLRFVSVVEKILTSLVLVLIAALVIIGLPAVEWSQLTTIEPSMAFLPFGVVLFAFGAASALPDMSRILEHRRTDLRRAIHIGSLIPIIVYMAFVVMTVGITGTHTTESAVLGLGQVLGNHILIIGSLFGILTMSTAFLSLGLVLKEVLMYDFKVSPVLAWLMVLLPPYTIVLGNFLSFVQILGLTGAIIGGVSGIIIMQMHRRLKTQADRPAEYHLTQSLPIHILVYLVFIAGIAYELVNNWQQLWP